MLTILYINSWGYDYLADSFLIGLKKKKDCVVYELPANQFIYKQSQNNLQSAHGKGFTLCNLLDPNTQNSFTEAVSFSSINVFVFSAIHRQYGLYLQLFPYLNRKNTIVLDGEDNASVFPYNSSFLRKPYLWFAPRPHKQFLYFKRELIPDDTNKYFYLKLLPKAFCKYIPLRSTIQEISFSIPAEKVIKQLPEKNKLFPVHIVDEEVAAKVADSHTKYAFEKEEDYYADLQASKFGITTKRAGWDCMRHYEIAANGAVICFRDLDKKPQQCAPHGLVDGVNCISYGNFQELMNKVDNMSKEKYDSLQQKSIEWVWANTCEKRASDTLDTLMTYAKTFR